MTQGFYLPVHEKYNVKRRKFLRSRLEIFCIGGDGGIRTLDPQIANLMLSQLSYVPNASAIINFAPRIVKKNFCAFNLCVV